jgi:hypothetical protein
MSRHSALALLSSLVVLACDAPATSPVSTLRPANAMVVNETGAVVFAIAASACSEAIVGSGTLHMRQLATTTENGALVGAFQETLQGSGTGASTGVRYQFTQITRQTVRITSGDAVTLKTVFRLNGQGAAPDLRVTASYKVAFNPNGDLTVYRDELRTSCE